MMHHNINVKAISEEYTLESGVNITLIQEITTFLSNTIYDAYNDDELQLGRLFGSKGEHWASNYIYSKMCEIGLSNIKKEKITNVPGSDELIQSMRDGDGNLTSKLEILDLRCFLNNSGDLDSIDCYISPRWNHSIDDKTYDKNLLTYNFSYENLEIIKTENYSCTDNFLSDVIVNVWPFGEKALVPDNLIFYNNFQDYKLLFNVTGAMEEEFQNYYNFTFEEIDPENNSTFPTFLRNASIPEGNFIFLEVYPKFHPTIQELPSIEVSPDYNELYVWTLVVRRKFDDLRMKAWYLCYPNCRGLIWYDYLNNSYDTGQKGTYLQ